MTEEAREAKPDNPAGRWPANVILDPEAAAMLDEQTGEVGGGSKFIGAGEVPRSAAKFPPGKGWNPNMLDPAATNAPNSYGDTGGASRFFHVVPTEDNEVWPTSPQTDTEPEWSGQRAGDGPSSSIGRSGKRPMGQSQTDSRSTISTTTSRITDSPTSPASPQLTIDGSTTDGSSEPGNGGSHARTVAEPSTSQATSTGGAPRTKPPVGTAREDALRFRYVPKASSEERNRGLAPGQRSSHPTVKPVELMQWLVRLVTPPGGTVLDPFTGSGSTGIAALREGFTFIGIERDPGYVEIARARIEGDAPLFNVQEHTP